MKFFDSDHEKFYSDYVSKYCHDKEDEILRARQASFYLLGMKKQIRENIDEILDIQGNNIGHEGNKLTDFLNVLLAQDQAIVRLAVNLLDSSRVLDTYPISQSDFQNIDFIKYRNNEEMYSVDYLFRNAYEADNVEYFIEAIKLKYPIN